MKINFKGAVAFAAAALLSVSAFAQSVEFTNELSSDVATIRKGKVYNGGEDETTKDFAGLEENVVATFTSEKVDAELDVTFILDDWNDKNFGFAWDDVSWFVEYRPVEKIALGFHEDVWLEGSYLPIYDDNVALGNLGSEGFTVAATPIEGLKIAVTVPFGEGDDGVNYFTRKDEDDETVKLNIGFGAEYAFEEMFTVGAAVSNVADSDNRGFGVYAMLKPLAEQDFVIRVGYSYSKAEGEITEDDEVVGKYYENKIDDLSISEDFGVFGKSLFNVSVEYSLDALSFSAETLFNTDDKSSDYDMYFAACVGYELSESLSADVTGKFLFDNSSNGAESVIGVNPNVAYTFGNHTFSAGLNYETCDGDSFISIPLSWGYSF
ncbi:MULTISPECIES: hypothetical protein [unclassified Treponema]|uniref:hypothetical protein n=1 Tax=unclassified Treponema TaxID=2638727 RepID=UPI000E7DDCD3|nr:MULTISPECIES: hypothetical protein [unclassified Treponema]HBP10159.1 hypothetical protein [Treponema sp.]